MFLPFVSLRLFHALRKKRNDRMRWYGSDSLSPFRPFSNATVFMSTNFAFVILKKHFFFLSVLDPRKPKTITWPCQCNAMHVYMYVSLCIHTLVD